MNHATRHIWEQLIDLAYDCFDGFRPNRSNRHVQAEIARTLGRLLRQSQGELAKVESGYRLFPKLDRSRRCLAEFGLILRIGRSLDAVTPESFQTLHGHLRRLRAMLRPSTAKGPNPEKPLRLAPQTAAPGGRVLGGRR